MPIFDYCCTECGFKQEVMRKSADASAMIDCPQCGKATFAKQVSAAGFQLKGSGWYATDFKSKPATQAKEEAKPSTTPCGGDCACH